MLLSSLEVDVAQSQNKDARQRVWTFVVFIESLTLTRRFSDWDSSQLWELSQSEAGYAEIKAVLLNDPQSLFNRLDAAHVKSAISPLHRFDSDSDTGSPVKPHWHVYVEFEGKRSFSQILSLMNEVAGNFHAPVPEPVNSKSALIRYLCHLDSPAKQLYEVNDVLSTGGFDPSPYLSANSQDIDRVTKQLIDIVKRERITEWSGLIDWIYANEPSLASFAFSPKVRPGLQAYINSVRYKSLDGLEDVGDGHKTCFYVYGDSGYGKTTLAKNLADKQGLEWFMTGASNDPMQGYAGQPFVILDDFRPDYMEFADFLRLTDPYNSTPVKSRYRNIDTSPLRQLVVTSILKPHQFCNLLKQTFWEEEAQFYRRFSMFIEVTAEKIIPYEWKGGDHNELVMIDKKVKENKLLEQFKKQTSSSLDLMALI